MLSGSIFPLIYVLIIALFAFSLWYNSARQKGKRGEKRIFSKLMQLPDEYTIMNDVIFKNANETTQIDHIVISKYGIFTIETKNYRGDIYGDDNRQEWTQMIVTEVTYAKKWWKTYTYVTKNHLYNPVKQSLGHAFKIKRIVSQSFPYLKVIPIVCFTGDVNLQNVESRYHVVHEDDLLSVINNYKTTYLTDIDVQTVVGMLQSKDVREVVKDSEHVRNVRTKVREKEDSIRAGICPRCGGHLVARQGKYGLFYGCSNYPKCRFTTK